MKQFDYKYVPLIEFDRVRDIERTLDDYGQKGWILVTYNHFKSTSQYWKEVVFTREIAA